MSLTSCSICCGCRREASPAAWNSDDPGLAGDQRELHVSRRYNRRHSMIETLGHYRILDRLGCGGIGEVYRARDTRLGRTVAVKIVRRDAFSDDAERTRLLDDARAAAALSHPHVAAFYEVGEEQGQVYLVSEFVPGHTLRTVIDGRPINARRALELAAQVADGLAQAHAHGMAHGDIRAENIVVTPKGSAKVMEPAFAAWTGEAARDDAPTDPTGDDILDLGRVLFEMLTGSAPEGRGDNPEAAVPSSLNPALPVEVDGVVARMMAGSQTRRFDSMAVAAASLRAVIGSLDERALPSEPVPTQVPTHDGSRLPWLVIALGLAVVAGLVYLATVAG
jgi:serine/threonine-protein kinase